MTGRVADEEGRGVRAEVRLVDVDRNTSTTASTNNNGLYVFPHVRPGYYRAEVSSLGYKTVMLTSLTLYTQDHVQQNFTLASGSPADSIVLVANGVPVETTGAVSTVVAQELVSELPLNGRSFQTLFQLTPGTVITATSFASQGQFSVNGERTNTNNFIVDGVSANFGIADGVPPGQSASGSLPALSVFGSTNTLVSTDDVQEFAVLTSSYSAEFGRMPGAQISIVTRSGMNQFSGSVFNYLRNDAFDANDWFANRGELSRARLRQNDFGGILGGPITKNSTFFFISFEGLRFLQPTSKTTDVPSRTSRNSASVAIKPFLDAFPLPNGPDQGNGLAPATYSFSNPSTLDSVAFRVDHHFRESLGIFVRYSYSASNNLQRGAGSNSLSTVTQTGVALQTLTSGLACSITPQVINDLRFNWSSASAVSENRSDDFEGAIPIPEQRVFPTGFSTLTSLFQFSPAVIPRSSELSFGRNVSNEQAQLNFIDDVAYQAQNHLIKVGIDFRHLLPKVAPAVYEQEAAFPNISSASTETLGLAAILTNTPVRGSFRNYSAYIQDTWRPSQRLSVIVGIRWDYAPSPAVHGANGLTPLAVRNVSNLPALSLAPAGTPLYHTTWDNFAPRLGLAYQLQGAGKVESVISVGGGVYYDLSNGPAGNAVNGTFFPFSAEKVLLNSSLPLAATDAKAPPLTNNPPFSRIQSFPTVLRTPYAYHWNVSLDQKIGSNQMLNVGYVGQAGHSLLRTEQYIGGNAGVPSTFTQLLFTANGGYSNFHALQVRYEARSRSTQLIASYSLSHSLDDVSTDAVFTALPARLLNPRVDYGPSDFDIRHVGTAGLNYTLHRVSGAPLVLNEIIENWSIQSIIVLRSALPVDVIVSRPVGVSAYDFRPDLIQGEPLYLSDSSSPGGRRINPAALAIAAGLQGDLARNFFRGFGLFQADLALRRQFRITERVYLQAGIEAFNVLNHPNFSNPAAQLGTIAMNGTFVPMTGFGVSKASLADGSQTGPLGSGFSPLYQVGGQRSLQLAFRVGF